MEKQNKPVYSVVIPVYNEEGCIDKLIKEIKNVFVKIGSSYEIIIVNDGSTDKTEEVLKNIKGIKIIKFRKNFGQSASLGTGTKEAKGKFVITLDGDGQNDPADFQNLISKLSEGYDVVCGWRHKRKDSFEKIIVSRVARGLRSLLVDDKVHDAGCTLRIFKKECFNDFDLKGEMHRMIPAVLRWRGFKITEIKVNHRPRTTGVSKYGTSRMIKGFLDMLLIWFTRKYNSRPLHLFGGAGLFLIFFSSLLLVFLAVMRLFYGYELSDKIWPLVGMMGFLTGLQLLVSGILADLIVNNNTKEKSWMIENIKEN